MEKQKAPGPVADINVTPMVDVMLVLLIIVIVVTPMFRSMRSDLVYQAVLVPAGIRVYCVPAAGLETPKNWTKSWHDIQEVTEQFLKLLFYRFYVLRHRLA
jgi:hypothetical protein